MPAEPIAASSTPIISMSQRGQDRRFEDLQAQIDAYNLEVERMTDRYNQAYTDWQAADEEYKATEIRQQQLAEDAVNLQRQNEKMVQEGLKIETRLNELTALIGKPERQTTPCDPTNFASAEAFEECQRTIFDGGPGSRPLEPRTQKTRKPFENDTMVVKPDWSN